MQYPTISSPLKEHIPRLDVVRAVAFLLVFVFHFGAMDPAFIVRWNGWHLDYHNWRTISWPLLWMSWGWLGVALFFVLSGFCIHLSFLHQSRPFTIRRFYWKRFLRIYPAYFVSLVVCVALMPVIPSHYKHASQIAPHLFLIHNFFKSTFTGINGAYWSLGVEAQFYLLYPLLLKWREKIGIGGCLVIALVLNLFCQIYFQLMRHTIESPISTYWSFPLVTWCDWVLGACLAEGFVSGRSIFPRKNLGLAVSFLFLAAVLNYKPLSVQSYLFASVFFALLMERYLAIRNPVKLMERLLIPVGVISYSLYLWHMPIILLLVAIGAWLKIPTTPPVLCLVFLPATLLVLAVVALASYYWIELGVPRWIRNRQRAVPDELGVLTGETSK